MEQSVVVLLLGVVLGCVVASGIWAVLWTLIKGDKRQQKDRIDMMRNIAVLCAELDGLFARRTVHGAAFQEFQSSVSSLLEKIHRNLTISMPLLDVYYIKYIESLIAHYQQAVAAVPGGETPAAIAEKAVDEEEAKTPVWEKDAAPMLATAAHFEVTQQYDLPKESPRPEPLDKKPSVPKMPSETDPMEKMAEINRGPAGSDIVETEKPSADFSDEIAFEFKHMSRDEAKGPIKGAADIKPEAKKISMEDTGEVDIEDMIKTQKIELKEEGSKTVKQQHQDEHFISGEDVIDKLDSFFGIDTK
jgi:hypothetical protein